jgi:hypothetical protein
MFKGGWWLIAVWSGFAVLAVAQRTEAFGDSGKAAIKMIETVVPDRIIQELEIELKDIGLNLGACHLQNFSRSLAVPHASLPVLACNINFVLA